MRRKIIHETDKVQGVVGMMLTVLLIGRVCASLTSHDSEQLQISEVCSYLE